MDAIRAASSRIEAVVFEPADFAASLQMPMLTGGVQVLENPATTSTTCSAASPWGAGPPASR